MYAAASIPRSVKLMQSKYLSLVLLTVMSLAVVVPIHQAFADEQRGIQVGDVLKLESVKGTAHTADEDGMTRATLSIALTVTSVNNTRVKFTVTSGQISFGDNVYTVTSGEGGAIAGKFGWITLHGSATSSVGQTLRFRLDGMFHHERPGLNLAGLFGGMGDEVSRTVLRFLAKVSKS